MNEQLTLQSTQHEETKTVPLRRRKACLAGTFALFAACALVLLIPHPAYAGIMEHVYDVIDGRYKAGKPMVITTNFDFRERILNATADDPWGRVFDRIVEVGFPVKYDGNSRRREIGMNNRKDFKRKLGIEGIES